MSASRGLNVLSIEKKYGYILGEPARADDILASELDADCAARASSLKRGDGVFVRRSDNTWCFAVVAHKVSGTMPWVEVMLGTKSKKSLTSGRWASSLRCIHRSTSPAVFTSYHFMNHLDSYLDTTSRKSALDDKCSQTASTCSSSSLGESDREEQLESDTYRRKHGMTGRRYRRARSPSHPSACQQADNLMKCQAGFQSLFEDFVKR